MLTLKKEPGIRHIIAVPYRNGRAGKARVLPDGAIMARPTQEQREHFGKSVQAFYPVDAQGLPTDDEEQTEAFVTFKGDFGYADPDGRVFVVYGASPDEISSPVG